MDKDKVLQIIADELCVEVEKLNSNTSFSEDLGADSLDLFQIIMAIESEFGIEIVTEDAEGIKTVGDVLKYLEGRV